MIRHHRLIGTLAVFGSLASGLLMGCGGSTAASGVANQGIYLGRTVSLQ